MYSSNSNSETVVNFIHRRKRDLRKVFHSKCCRCGFNEVETALEFHHVNPKEKGFSIGSSSNQTKALEPQLQELKKCILLCANCHRGIHEGIYSVPNNWEQFYDVKVANELRDNLGQVKKHKIYYCQHCGVQIFNKNAKYCDTCHDDIVRKAKRPSRDELKDLIRNKPFTQIGKQFGVTDNSVRKWCNSLNLPSKKKDIDYYSDAEWEKI